MVKQAGKERRQFIRAQRVLSIQFRLHRQKGSRKPIHDDWHLSTTQDMSLGGLSFGTDKEYHVGDILETQVVMSGILDIYKGFSEVVRVSRKTTGAYYILGVKYVSSTRFTRHISTVKKVSRRLTSRTTSKRALGPREKRSGNKINN